MNTWLLIFCGLIPFLGFSDALSAGVGSVTQNANLIKNTLFPIDLVPVKAVLVSQCTQLVGTGLLLMTIALLGKLTWWTLLLPLAWAGQVLFSVGLLWILSSLNVYFRDLQNMVSVAILFLMMTSPIAYTADMVPAAMRPFLKLNPLYYLITSYQDCLMIGQMPHNGAALGMARDCRGLLLRRLLVFRTHEDPLRGQHLTCTVARFH